MDLVDLEDGELGFFASAGLRVKTASGDFIPCNVVADRSLDAVSKTTSAVG